MPSITYDVTAGAKLVRDYVEKLCSYLPANEFFGLVREKTNSHIDMLESCADMPKACTHYDVTTDLLPWFSGNGYEIHRCSCGALLNIKNDNTWPSTAMSVEDIRIMMHNILFDILDDQNIRNTTLDRMRRLTKND